MIESDTTTITRDQSDRNSNILGVSVRAWVTLLLVVGVVLNQAMVTALTLYNATVTKDFSLVGSLTTIGEPFYTLASIAIGFYFGQKLK